MRHALLGAAFGGLLALPIVSVVAPAIRIAGPAAPALTVAANATAPVAAHAGGGVRAAVPQAEGLSLTDLLLAGWIGGTVLCLLPVVMGLWQVRSLRRSAAPWRHGQAIVERLALGCGIHRRVEALLHGALQGPMTCGAAHPAVVLPEEAQTWEEENLTRAMVHELEHVRRGDWAIHCLARGVCAMYWFHPLVWIAWRRLALEAERCCDDAVLARSDATAYADQLVGLAQRAKRAPVLAMANRADLATRVGAVLDSRQRRGRAGRFWVALACAASAVLVLTISPLRMAAAPQSPAPAASATGMLRFSVNGMLVMVAVTVTDQSGRPIEGLSSSDFMVTEDGAAQTISVFEFQKAEVTSPPSISSYYLMGYYSANPKLDGQFRKIQITRTGDASVLLNYRPGYYAPSREGASSVANGAASDIRPPVVIYKKGPEYTEEARRAKYQGTVLLEAEINESGAVTTLKVIRSLGLGLDDKAMDAVKQWRFRPGMKDGKPVAVVSQVEVNFRLL